MVFDANFDRQKMMYHPGEVAVWLREGRTRGPIYTEMELCSRCNCRCVFCGVDHLVNKTSDTIDADLAQKVIAGLHELGNRSIMFCGHGEPLLNPHAHEIIDFASQRMSTSVTTNGTCLTEGNLPLIDGLEWIRFSINAGTEECYAAVHGTAPEMFERVLTNIARTVERKRRRALDVVVGSQLVLIDENADTVVELARRMKDLGVDYFSVKPYSQHPLSENERTVDYARLRPLAEQLEALDSESFRVIYRQGSIAKVHARKPYAKCYGTHFLCFAAASGDLWECNVFVGDERFRIGNVRDQTVPEIWAGPRRQKVLHFIEHELDVDLCRDICRMDECNTYLWRLKHPWAHDNFI